MRTTHCNYVSPGRLLALGAVVLLGIVTLMGSGGGGGGDGNGDGGDAAPPFPSAVRYSADFGGLVFTIGGVTLRTSLGLHGVFRKTPRLYTLDGSTQQTLTGLFAELEPADGAPTLDSDGEIRLQVEEALRFVYGSPPTAGVLRLGGANPVMIRVNNNVDGTGQAGVELEYIEFGSTTASSSHTWMAFVALMDDGAAPDYQRAASAAWHLLRIVYDHVQTLMEQTVYLTENDMALQTAGSNVGIESACDPYPGSQGTRRFIWTDGPGENAGELGPGDNFRVTFSDCYLDRDTATPGTLYHDGLVRLNEYLENRTPFALGFFDTRFEALRSERADKDNGAPLPGTEVIADSFRIVNNQPDDSLGFQFILQPDDSTIINIGNQLETAITALESVQRPPLTGGQVLDLLVATLAGDPPGDFCSGGGAYGFDPPPVGDDAPAAGKAYVLEFEDCVLDASDPTVIDGTATLTLDSLSGTLAQGGSYQATLTLDPIAVNIVDDAGPTTLSGATRFTRNATADAFTESSPSIAGKQFVVTEESFSLALGPYAIAGSREPGTGDYTLGTAGQQVLAERSDLPGILTIAVEQALAGTGSALPIAGRLRVTAEDASRLTITFGAATVTLALDTDGDGTVDDTTEIDPGDL